MGCGAQDAAQCLHDHVRPWLSEPKVTDAGDGYSAIAPCHDDTTRSLTVSAGRRMIVWCCHACQRRLGKEAAQIRTRSWLIRAGVPMRCLPMTRAQVDSLVDQFREILHGGTKQVEKVFMLAMLTECGGEMPRGGELDRLAEWCGVSRRSAYEAVKVPLPGSPDNR